MVKIGSVNETQLSDKEYCILKLAEGMGCSDEGVKKSIAAGRVYYTDVSVCSGYMDRKKAKLVLLSIIVNRYINKGKHRALFIWIPAVSTADAHSIDVNILIDKGAWLINKEFDSTESEYSDIIKKRKADGRNNGTYKN